VLVNCAPLFDYGTTGGTWTYSGDGYNSMRVAAPRGDLELSIAGTIPLGRLRARCYGRTTMAAGESAFVALSWGANTIPATLDEAFSALNHTIDFWRAWLSTAKIPDHPWRIYLDRSALTLKGLSYCRKRSGPWACCCGA
jgi:alpha,alpha-trehalase